MDGVGEPFLAQESTGSDTGVAAEKTHQVFTRHAGIPRKFGDADPLGGSASRHQTGAGYSGVLGGAGRRHMSRFRDVESQCGGGHGSQHRLIGWIVDDCRIARQLYAGLHGSGERQTRYSRIECLTCRALKLSWADGDPAMTGLTMTRERVELYRTWPHQPNVPGGYVSRDAIDGHVS